MEHRIILVREWDAQVTGSGCCRLGGEGTMLGDTDTFSSNRTEMEKMGEVYRALRAELFEEEVEIAVVDPRNQVWLVPALFRDARKRGLSPREIWRQVRSGVSYNAVIVDGKVLFSGNVPSAEDAVAAARAALSPAMA